MIRFAHWFICHKESKVHIGTFIVTFSGMQSDFGLFLNTKMNRQDLRNFEDAITIFCTFTLDRVRERNHLLTQMIWQNNFREKKSFFFRFNQNGKIPISCPFFTVSNGYSKEDFPRKLANLHQNLPCGWQDACPEHLSFLLHEFIIPFRKHSQSW